MWTFIHDLLENIVESISFKKSILFTICAVYNDQSDSLFPNNNNQNWKSLVMGNEGFKNKETMSMFLYKGEPFCGIMVSV